MQLYKIQHIENYSILCTVSIKLYSWLSVRNVTIFCRQYCFLLGSLYKRLCYWSLVQSVIICWVKYIYKHLKVSLLVGVQQFTIVHLQAMFLLLHLQHLLIHGSLSIPQLLLQHPGIILIGSATPTVSPCTGFSYKCSFHCPPRLFSSCTLY